MIGDALRRLSGLLGRWSDGVDALAARWPSMGSPVAERVGDLGRRVDSLEAGVDSLGATLSHYESRPTPTCYGPTCATCVEHSSKCGCAYCPFRVGDDRKGGRCVKCEAMGCE